MSASEHSGIPAWADVGVMMRSGASGCSEQRSRGLTHGVVVRKRDRRPLPPSFSHYSQPASRAGKEGLILKHSSVCVCLLCWDPEEDSKP